MKTCAAFLLLAFMVPLAAPPAAAEGFSFCVDSLCIEETCLVQPICDISGYPSCPSTHRSVTGFWHYRLGDGTIRDPPLEGLYYAATWSYSHHYESTPTGCQETAYSCRVQVSDGSHFQYLRVGTASAANGEYKGVFTNGGSLSCGDSSATLSTFGAFLIMIHGYGSKTPSG